MGSMEAEVRPTATSRRYSVEQKDHAVWRAWAATSGSRQSGGLSPKLGARVAEAMSRLSSSTSTTAPALNSFGNDRRGRPGSSNGPGRCASCIVDMATCQALLVVAGELSVGVVSRLQVVESARHPVGVVLDDRRPQRAEVKGCAFGQPARRSSPLVCSLVGRWRGPRGRRRTPRCRPSGPSRVLGPK